MKTKMKTKMKTNLTARIFSDIGGYYWCDRNLPYIDTRGGPYASKSAAMRSAYVHGYTHGIGSGVYRDGALLSQIRPAIQWWEQVDHERTR